MSAQLAHAVELLRAGELVAFPTETVYGLGAAARNPAAVAKIFAAKGRPADHPLIVHLPDATHLEGWARNIPEAARALAAAFWPGPLTLILKRQPGVPAAVTGGQDTVGLRVPNHPLALELLREFNDGIAAPSANRFGRISPTTAQHVRDDLGTRVSLILDGGPCQVGIESTIVDLSGATPRILRPGMLSASDMARVLGDTPLAAEAAPATIRVSGNLEAHYAPRTPLVLCPGEYLTATLQDGIAQQLRIAVLATFPAPFDHHDLHWKVAPADPAGFARDLYAQLRELDALGCDRIVVQLPVGAVWQAIHDRLKRAATGSGTPDTRD